MHNTRLETQETILQARALWEALGQREIERVREDLRKQARGLERLVRSTVAGDEARFAGVRRECGELWGETERVRAALFALRMRAERLEESMGFRRS